ncbi:hypothetical protein CEXT_439651 [Caerostris extrusa]|uniref:Uncharacterized protein n=1 Tax=Caerostris extrusa TaxID=172846 RepID=A0AAV4X0Z3_CAEEX|nr:hypothetical protein CEXT_439651 [Caerostris extrusa]
MSEEELYESLKSLNMPIRRSDFKTPTNRENMKYEELLELNKKLEEKCNSFLQIINMNVLIKMKFNLMYLENID